MLVVEIGQAVQRVVGEGGLSDDVGAAGVLIAVHRRELAKRVSFLLKI